METHSCRPKDTSPDVRFTVPAQTAARGRDSDSRSFYVYRHTGPNQKVYIGVTSQYPERRWGKNGNGYKNSPHFFAAIQKHGWDNFEHEVLLAGLTQDEASEMEIQLIAAHDSTCPDKGYNHATGGSVNCGFHLSEERKAQISAYSKGRKMPPEAIARTRMANLGKRHSEESKQKMRAAKLGKKLSPETREKMRVSNRGKRNRRVICIDTGVEYYSLDVAEQQTGAKHENISKVCKGKRRTAGGLRWRYADE